jgi:hypothetical protein
MSAEQTEAAKRRKKSRHKKPLTGLRIDPAIAGAVKELAGITGKSATALFEEAALQLLEDYGASLPKDLAARQRALKAHRLD